MSIASNIDLQHITASDHCHLICLTDANYLSSMEIRFVSLGIAAQSSFKVLLCLCIKKLGVLARRSVQQEQPALTLSENLGHHLGQLCHLWHIFKRSSMRRKLSEILLVSGTPMSSVSVHYKI